MPIGGRTPLRAVALVAGALVAALTASTTVAAATLPGSFRGDAYGTDTTITAGPIGTALGKTANLPCPCQGTNGVVKRNNVTSLSVGTSGRVLRADAVTSTVFARKNDNNTAEVSNTSTIAGLNLLNGLIRATAVRAVANVNATATLLGGATAGSTFTNLIVNGNSIAANPAPGTTISLPGVGSLVLNRVTITGSNSRARNVRVEMLTIEVDLANGFGLPVGARVIVAHAAAGFVRTTLPAFVGGQAYAATASAEIGAAIQNRIGRAALVTIGCDGTGGETRTNNVASLDVGRTLSIGTGTTTAFGGRDGSGTIARTTATVENAGLLALPPTGIPLIRFTTITAVAQDKFNGTTHTRSAAGSQFAGLRIAGLVIPINVAPNTRVDIPLFGYVIVNEQVIPAAGRKGTMSVNGLRLVISRANALGLPIGSQIIVAHAEANAQR